MSFHVWVIKPCIILSCRARKIQKVAVRIATYSILRVPQAQVSTLYRNGQRSLRSRDCSDAAALDPDQDPSTRARTLQETGSACLYLLAFRGCLYDDCASTIPLNQRDLRTSRVPCSLVAQAMIVEGPLARRTAITAQCCVGHANQVPAYPLTPFCEPLPASIFAADSIYAIAVEAFFCSLATTVSISTRATRRSSLCSAS